MISQNLVLLHGPAIVASRKYLTSIKEKFLSDDILVFEKGFKEESLKDALTTIAMFETNRLIIIENPGDDFVIKNISLSEGFTLVIWIDHEITTSKKLFKFVAENKGQIINFPEGKETSVFPLLDLLANKDPQAFIELSKLKNEGFDTFYILTMILYLLRNLVATPKNVPIFVQEKLVKQRKKFSKREIKELYKSVLELDYKLKTGRVEKDQADFLLVSLFIS